MKKFTAFCCQYNIMDPFPVTEHLLCCFAAYMADGGLSAQTVKGYLAAVRNTQLSLGLPDPREHSSLPILKRVQAGISRSRLGRGQAARVRLPITACLLLQIGQALIHSEHPERRALWAVCCTAFFGFFRLGELLLPAGATFDPTRHLAWGDMAVDNMQSPRMIRFHLKHSKTDQFGRGADIVLGRTGLQLCPVAAVLSYVACRGAGAGPFFLTSGKKTLTKAHFITEIRGILDTLGFTPQDYAGHSFRIGAATSAALAGIEDSTIQLLGRWQSDAFLRYIRTPHERLAALSTTLATQGHSTNASVQGLTPAP
jgi:hypothetical protein